MSFSFWTLSFFLTESLSWNKSRSMNTRANVKGEDKNLELAVTSSIRDSVKVQGFHDTETYDAECVNCLHEKCKLQGHANPYLPTAWLIRES